MEAHATELLRGQVRDKENKESIEKLACEENDRSQADPAVQRREMT